MFGADGFGAERGIAQLNRAERLLVTAVRRLVAGLGLCGGILREFDSLCGPQSQEVLARIRLFLDALDRTARRPLTVAPPGWFAPTGDERQLLAMIEAAQGGEESRLAALACWFARRDVQPLLVEATHLLAGAMASHHLRISASRPAAEVHALRDPAAV